MRVVVLLGVVATSTGAHAAPKACIEATTVNGLWICGEPKEAPSHGGEASVLNAHYTLENRGTSPVVVELVSLDVLDPQDKPLRLAIDHANFLPAPNRVTRATIAPGKRHDLVIFGKGSIAGLRYHVVYRHRVLFRVDGTERAVRASEMYFRYPHKRI